MNSFSSKATADSAKSGARLAQPTLKMSRSIVVVTALSGNPYVSPAVYRRIYNNHSM